MKTDITHTILVAISREAVNRGFRTTLEYGQGDWSLEGRKADDYMWIDRNTKIGEIDAWMAPIDDLIEAGGEESCRASVIAAEKAAEVEDRDRLIKEMQRDLAFYRNLFACVVAQGLDGAEPLAPYAVVSRPTIGATEVK